MRDSGAPIKPIPVRAGVGLKPDHYQYILANLPDIGWLEVHPENYMVNGGAQSNYLSAISEHYPLSMHGVGLSLGSMDGLDLEHLKALKKLLDQYQPAVFSEHLSWSRFGKYYLNDLLPVAYNAESLKQFVNNVRQAQDYLERRILIENPSSYFELDAMSFTEAEFLIAVAHESDCDILLDVNNLYVSAINHQFDADEYLAAIPPERVKEYHLAGHSIETHDFGTLRIDDHGSEVSDPVWDLYDKALNQIGTRATLIEWDTNIPEWQVLYEEALHAEARLKHYQKELCHAD